MTQQKRPDFDPNIATSIGGSPNWDDNSFDPIEDIRRGLEMAKEPIPLVHLICMKCSHEAHVDSTDLIRWGGPPQCYNCTNDRMSIVLREDPK